MDTQVLQVVLAGVVAAALGWSGPRLIAAVPEPVDADPDKPTYVSIAAAPRLALWLALAAGLLAAISAAYVPGRLIPAWVIFCAGGVIVSYIDIRTRLLPFALTVPLHLLCAIAVFAAAGLSGDGRMAVRAFVSNIIVFGFLWLIWAAGRRFGGGGFGYGDVRLGAVCGLVLGAVGIQQVWVGTYGAFVLGAVFGIVLSLARLVDRKAFAFGPYLVLGAVVGVVLAPVL